jgi:hypothetical protein
MKDIIIIDHVSHFGKDPHYTDKDDARHQLNLLHKLAKDLKRTQIRKEKIKKNTMSRLVDTIISITSTPCNDPWIYTQSINRVNRTKTKSQIRKEKIKRILLYF